VSFDNNGSMVEHFYFDLSNIRASEKKEIQSTAVEPIPGYTLIPLLYQFQGTVLRNIRAMSAN